MIPRASATTIIVAYRTGALDLTFVPQDQPVVVVHNDDHLDKDSVRHAQVTHVRSGNNVGFGRAVNRAVEYVDTSRIVLVNPDVSMGRDAWEVLAGGSDGAIQTIGLTDSTGVPTSVLAPYPTPSSIALTAWRAGRVVPRSVRLRLPSALVGRWTAEQMAIAQQPEIEKPLLTHWVSGAVMALGTDMFRSVGGFDDAYFLYFEDVDLCRRLADRWPDLKARVEPFSGVHLVSASSSGNPGMTDLHHAQSAYHYARRFGGVSGALARGTIQLRMALLR